MIVIFRLYSSISYFHQNDVVFLRKHDEDQEVSYSVFESSAQFRKASIIMPTSHTVEYHLLDGDINTAASSNGTQLSANRYKN